MTHELTMKQNMEEEAKKRKIIALKSIANKEKESEDSEESEEDEELALTIRKFSCFMKMKRPNFKRRSFSKGELSKEREKDKGKKPSIYFECKKLGHLE